MPAVIPKIVGKRSSRWMVLILQVVLVFLLIIAIWVEWLPLGVLGEWRYNRLPVWASPRPEWLGLVGLAVVAYAGFVALGLRGLSARQSHGATTLWLGGLLVAAVAVQVLIPMGAAPGYDLSKWAPVNYHPSSGGWCWKIAREQAVRDPWRFLAEYPEWIRSRGSTHIGTHPPGLIVVQCILIRVLERYPPLAHSLLDHMPPSVQAGFRVLEGEAPHSLIQAERTRPEAERAILYSTRLLGTARRHWPSLNRADRATVCATALLTLLACAGTVVPLYLLARAELPAPTAWVAAAFWPLAPAANLFQPLADTAYPLLSTSALALASWAARCQQEVGRPTLALVLLGMASGAVMAFGMLFTLAFLPVGLIVAFIVGSDRALRLPRRAALLIATGSGFLALTLGVWIATGADPFVVWGWNLHHNARFYVEYPRSYALWLWINPIEVAIAVGLPTMVWCVTGLFAPRTVHRSVWATLTVLVLADLAGGNRGEVARLWMLFFPPLLISAATACTRLGGGPVTPALSAALVGLQTLALQLLIQVVYPM
jgi:hypothetical protein